MRAIKKTYSDAYGSRFSDPINGTPIDNSHSITVDIFNASIFFLFCEMCGFPPCGGGIIICCQTDRRANARVSSFIFSKRGIAPRVSFFMKEGVPHDAEG